MKFKNSDQKMKCKTIVLEGGYLWGGSNLEGAKGRLLAADGLLVELGAGHDILLCEKSLGG